MHYCSETSAKTGEHVKDLFIDVAKFLYLKHRESLDNPDTGSTLGRSEVTGSMLTDNGFRKGSIANSDVSAGNFGQYPQ